MVKVKKNFVAADKKRQSTYPVSSHKILNVLIILKTLNFNEL